MLSRVYEKESNECLEETDVVIENHTTSALRRRKQTKEPGFGSRLMAARLNPGPLG
jgi:hypothetical protein